MPTWSPARLTKRAAAISAQGYVSPPTHNLARSWTCVMLIFIIRARHPGRHPPPATSARLVTGAPALACEGPRWPRRRGCRALLAAKPPPAGWPRGAAVSTGAGGRAGRRAVPGVVPAGELHAAVADLTVAWSGAGRRGRAAGRHEGFTHR